ncbi:MAG: hypothetical protein ACO38N_00920 [Candidatus Nanopelagicales bacterium]
MKRFLVALVSVLIGAGVVAGVAVFASTTSGEPPLLVATPTGMVDTPDGPMNSASLELAVYPNNSDQIAGPMEGVNALYASQGWPFYWPSTTLQVPANSLITMTITQYDSGGRVFNPYWAKVHGTADGTMTVNGKTVSEWDVDKVGHTFTVHQYPGSGQPYFFLSVPLPANGGNAVGNANPYVTDPKVVTFTFRTGAAGTYVWNCEFPCGDLYQEFGGPMQQRGWMSGTFEVV